MDMTTHFQNQIWFAINRICRETLNIYRYVTFFSDFSIKKKTWNWSRNCQFCIWNMNLTWNWSNQPTKPSEAVYFVYIFTWWWCLSVHSGRKSEVIEDLLLFCEVWNNENKSCKNKFTNLQHWKRSCYEAICEMIGLGQDLSNKK